MGLLQQYAIYKYGKKRGEKIYAKAVQAAAFAEKENAVKEQEDEKCIVCNWEKFRHGPKAECPVYPELELE